MWKYLAILAFLVVSIREINLMYNSLYVAPHVRKVVFEDKTFAAQIRHLIDEEKEYITQLFSDTNLSQNTPALPETKSPTNTTPSPTIPPKKHTKVVIVSRTKPTHITSYKEHNISQTPNIAPTHTLSPTKEHIATAPSDLPTNYESAQERVQKILEQMRGY